MEKYIVYLVEDESTKKEVESFDTREQADSYMLSLAEYGLIFSLEKRKDAESEVIF